MVGASEASQVAIGLGDPFTIEVGEVPTDRELSEIQPHGTVDERHPADGVSLVIPAGAGDTRVESTVQRFDSALATWGIDYEILVVTDFCQPTVPPEGTPAVGRTKRLFFAERLGKGGAVLRGIERSRFDTVAIMDADGPVSPSQLHDVISRLDGCAAVIGSRRAPGSKVTQRAPLRRRLASRAFNAFVRATLFVPQLDTQCGVKVISREKTRGLLTRVAVWGFAFDVSLLFHIHEAGLEVREVGVEWEHRDGSTLRMVRAVPKMFASVLGIRLRNSPAGVMIPEPLVEAARRWLNSP